MPRRKNLLTFHGSFKSKAAARRREKKVGGFMLKRRVRGKTRYVVVERRTR